MLSLLPSRGGVRNGDVRVRSERIIMPADDVGETGDERLGVQVCVCHGVGESEIERPTEREAQREKIEKQ